MKGTKPQQRAMSILFLSFPRENSQLEKSDTNVTMFTEEQIQRLVKIAVDEDYDENQAEKEIRLTANLLKSVHDFLTIFGYGETMKKAVGFFEEEIFRRQLRFLNEMEDTLKTKEQTQV